MPRARNPPMTPLLRAGTKESRIRNQRNDDRATICQIDSKRVIREVHIPYTFASVRTGSVHAISPKPEHDWQRPSAERAEAPRARSRGLQRAQLVRARTSPTRHHGPRGYGAVHFASRLWKYIRYGPYKNMVGAETSMSSQQARPRRAAASRMPSVVAARVPSDAPLLLPCGHLSAADRMGRLGEWNGQRSPSLLLSGKDRRI
jgi:hypothetical protein